MTLMSGGMVVILLLWKAIGSGGNLRNSVGLRMDRGEMAADSESKRSDFQEAV